MKILGVVFRLQCCHSAVDKSKAFHDTIVISDCIREKVFKTGCCASKRTDDNHAFGQRGKQKGFLELLVYM